MIDFVNDTSIDIDLQLPRQILVQLTNRPIELVLTTNEIIHRVNYDTRGIDKATDVLSFPYINMPNTPLGSIMISIDFVKQNASKYNHTINDEFVLLFIHGLLHLLGYDHEKDNNEQREKEEDIIKQYNLPASLIVRNS